MRLDGERVLVTGASGWLGRFVVKAAVDAGALVTGLDLAPPRPGVDGVVADLAAGVPVLGQPFDRVIHLAGLAHRVPRTAAESERFFQVNAEGTRNLLRGLEALPETPRAIVLISTVAVYGLERGEGVGEGHPREARDPYGMSKIMAEDALTEWAHHRGVRAAIVRPPLVVGPAAPGNLGAMITALRRRRYLSVAGGGARRSVVCADDLARGILVASDHEGAFHLTDGCHPSFRELEEAFCRALDIASPAPLPLFAARVAAAIGDRGSALLRRDLPFGSGRLSKMTSHLTFDDTKARTLMSWNPDPVTSRAKWIVGA